MTEDEAACDAIPPPDAEAVARAPRVHIVIVNYGPGWDTLECLESVLRLRYPNRQVVVCDNGPGDAAARLIRDWAAGRIELLPGGTGTTRQLCLPPVPKPIRHIDLTDADIEAGTCAADSSAPLVLIASRSNRGFAGGNNLALRYALACGDSDHVWLLNNDTVVDPDALSEMVRGIEADPAAGICGSTLLHYFRPDQVQARGGGRYDRWFGRTRLVGNGEPLTAPESDRTPPLHYVHGASMLVRRAFLEQVGLLEERYFLYFEELDWVARARGRFRLTYAPRSLVYHKEGGSAGSATRVPERRSRLSDYYGIRSRILYTRRFYPWALPTIYLGLLGALLNRARRRQWDRIPMILRLMVRPG